VVTLRCSDALCRLFVIRAEVAHLYVYERTHVRTTNEHMTVFLFVSTYVQNFDVRKIRCSYIANIEVLHVRTDEQKTVMCSLVVRTGERVRTQFYEWLVLLNNFLLYLCLISYYWQWQLINLQIADWAFKNDYNYYSNKVQNLINRKASDSVRVIQLWTPCEWCTILFRSNSLLWLWIGCS
jgi:hypothetical protein